MSRHLSIRQTIAPKPEQRQKLAITASLQHSLAILQMNQTSLEEHLQKELAKNPFLEIEHAPKGPAMPSFGGGDRMAALENSAGTQTLLGHIRAHIPLLKLSRSDNIRAEYLIRCLDESGYLVSDGKPWPQRLRCERGAFEALLSKLQAIGPPGIFARNLAECLRLQLIELNRFDPMIARALERLDLVARLKIDNLMRHCEAGEGDVIEMIKEIQALDPHPGLVFAAKTEDISPPDVLIATKESGDITIGLNPACFPKLVINDVLLSQCRASTKDRQSKQFHASKFQSATRLKRAVERRAETLLNVAKSIVARQEAFFQTGEKRDLIPLRQIDIANELKLHVSTINRAIAAKSFLTNWGVIDPHILFPHQVTTHMGDYSSQEIQSILLDIIAREARLGVQSDEDLADSLSHKGVPIARRTVAKYRKILGIPTASVRKRMMRVQAH